MRAVVTAGQDRCLRPALFDARQYVRHDLRLGLHALRAAVVETHTHRAGFHVKRVERVVLPHWILVDQFFDCRCLKTSAMSVRIRDDGTLVLPLIK